MKTRFLDGAVFGLMMVFAMAPGAEALADPKAKHGKKKPAKVATVQRVQTATPPDAPPSQDHPDVPSKPVKDDAQGLPPDDTIFGLTPAPDLQLRTGYTGFGDSNGFHHGGGIGGLLFLDNGFLGVALRTNVAGMGDSPYFAFAEGDLKLRIRMPLDPENHRLWAAFGGDIAGRGAVAEANNPSYLRVQPAALIGTMFATKDKSGQVRCVFHAFGKVGLGIYDNQTATQDRWAMNWDNWLRPSVGAEGLAQCDLFRVTADYEHIFTLGPAGDTDRAGLELSKTWPVTKWLQLGFFGRGDVAAEHGATGVVTNDPKADTYWEKRVFFGISGGFGVVPEKFELSPSWPK